MSKRSRTEEGIASSLLSCHNRQCQNNQGHKTKPNQITSHRVDVKCLSCQKFWIVCITCKRKFTSSKISLANKHFEENHSSQEFNLGENNIASTTYSVTSNMNLQVINACLSASSLPSKSQFFFETKLHHCLMLYRI